jgi:hypothetical protein
MGKTTEEMQTGSTFSGWTFTGDEGWRIVEGQTYPYLAVCQSIPAMITEAVKSSVTINLANNAEKVIVYIGNNKIVLTGANATAGTQTYTTTELGNLAVGDVLTFVVYETNKAPSYRTSATVLPSITGISPDGDVATVEIGDNLVLSFDQAVTAVATKTISISDGSDTWTYEIPADADIISGDGKEATIPFETFLDGGDPISSFTTGETYTVSVEAGAFASAGVSIAAYSGSFTATITEPDDITFPTISTSFAYSSNKKLSTVALTTYATGGGEFTWANPDELITVGTKAYAAVFTQTNTDDYDYSGVTGWDTDHVAGSINLTMLANSTPGPTPTPTPVQTYEVRMAALPEGLATTPGINPAQSIVIEIGDDFCFTLFGVQEGWKPEVTTSRGSTGIEVDGPQANGYYNICVKNIRESLTITISLTAPTGILEPADTEASIYPNPVRDAFTIDNGSKPIRKVTVNDLSGRRVTETTPGGATSVQIDASSWASGLYIVTIESANSLRRLKVMKK